MADHTNIHATCVALNNRGVLLTGKSGSGKSDLALRLIEAGAILVSDDQVVVTNRCGKLFASPPAKLAGLLEVRGVGICTYPFLETCELFVVVNLDDAVLPERLPDLETQKQNILGISLTVFQLDPFRASSPAKIPSMLKLINQ